ncbi:type II restriction endonuclease [Serratia marcescens]|uniref:type II restriction endonuclease n=1 Tax=Serratia TaxID=613 RepID=UPI00186628FA|nr:type II restriction endonuclease [Serratia marcescens]MBN5272025.1 restriction endonuclease [Serratia marcescens]MBN5276555.1 restriction endonuclease [Serratia marcescens]MBN5304458.1 restriction endonuclease [Serratia marcescens]MBN5361430.1 restriction endonuclease [Serratia marcescens]MBN5419436.1 restriction endonuclease [Serratia marcescens]
MSNFQNWLNEKSSNDWYIHIKRLSANDTGATGGHQSGVYLPKNAANFLFPSINRIDEENPSVELIAKTLSHNVSDTQVRAVYYNSKPRTLNPKGRNETRITCWGGKKSPLQNQKNTGALAIFCFSASDNLKDCDLVEVWVCSSIDEEDLVETIIGEVLPGTALSGLSTQLLGGFAIDDTNWKSRNYEIPEHWKVTFPNGSEIIEYLPKIFKFKDETPDKLLLERREKEYDLFRQIEELHVLDKVKEGFDSVEEFIELANSVSNRRKSRSGKSLEMHLEKIFVANGLVKFTTQSVTEGKKKPDFLFPSGADYHNPAYPAEKLRMLAVKTTCKDRWRQALNEADRIDKIHLFTLQEGVSVNQFQEMKDAGVTLVVPKPLHDKYPKEIREKLVTLSGFIAEMKSEYDNE